MPWDDLPRARFSICSAILFTELGTARVTLLVDASVMEIRPRAGAIKLPRRDVMQGIIGSVTNLLFIESLDDLLMNIANTAASFASVEQVIIWIVDENGDWRPIASAGFSEETRSRLFSISLSPSEERRTQDAATWRTRFSLFVPGEVTQEVGFDREDFALFLDKEAATKPRISSDSWQELDFLEVRLISLDGKLIGSIELRKPVDGKIPSMETIQAVEILASICSIAIELARLREKETAISEAAERRSAQITQILSFARNVLSLESPEKVFSTILTIVRDLFGFRSASISVFDERDNCFKYVAMIGYGADEIEYAKTLRIAPEAHRVFTSPDHMIGRNAYYLPAEELPDESLVWEIYTPDSYADLKKSKHAPRPSPGAWHPQDNLTFTLQNKMGKVSGVLSADNPKDGRIPPMEVIDGISIFASLAAIAMENMKYYSETLKAKDDIEMLNTLLFHDVSNLNTTIREYLDIASNQVMPKDQKLKHIRSAQRELDSMIDLIQKVRRLSSIRSSTTTELLRLDLAAAIRTQVSRTVSKFPDRRIRETYGSIPANCYVLANDLIGDLFGNIISNAIVHNLSDEVQIGISIEGVLDEFSNKNYWKVSISDNGTGIPDDRKLQLFDITARLRESMGQTGIGLSVVKAIVNLYGGSIWVEDRNPADTSKGSVFQVLLPAA